jgi:DNA transformation protein and related proteins
MKAKSEIASLKNLGPKSEAWLNAIGIYTRDDLQKIGAVGAFHLLKLRGYNPSLVLVYAIEGALCDVHWNELPPHIKAKLQREAAD